MIWPHGTEKPKDFLGHLINIHHNIQFTMETETDCHLPLLDIVTYRSHGSLGHTMYREPTHTNLYSNVRTHYPPANKQAVISTFGHTVKVICEQGSLHTELKFFHRIYRQNGYSNRQILYPLVRVT
jgi:hypothetical protein